MTANIERVNQMEVRLYPELIAAAFACKEIDLYIVWHFVHVAQQEAGATNQILSVRGIRTALQLVLGISPGYAYAKFKEGIGTYWNAPGTSKSDPKEKVTGLISAAKVHTRLGQRIGVSRPFIVPISEFYCGGERGWLSLRAKLFGMVAERNEGAKPIALATLSRQLGLSRSTLKRLRAANPNLRVYKNLSEIADFRSSEQAFSFVSRLMQEADKGKTKPYRVQERDGRWYVYRQMPNSYCCTTLQRGSLRSRPKELRVLRQDFTEDCAPRRYIDRDAKRQTLPVDSVYYIPKCDSRIHSVGSVRIWMPQNMRIDSKILNYSTPLRTRRATVGALDILPLHTEKNRCQSTI